MDIQEVARKIKLPHRRRCRELGFVLMALAAMAHADSTVSSGPVADWVVPLAFQRLTPRTETNSGMESRLLLHDVQINAKTRETFHNEARQILTSQGVQVGSQFSIDFDPACQAVILHWVKVWRASNSTDRLDLSRVRVIQPERDLDEYLFTGNQTALLLLEDVRPGDIIDYACTIRGDNLLGGQLSGEVPVQKYEPVERLTTRLIWPTNRHLYIKGHGTSARPSVVRTNGLVEYTWDFRRIPALRPEDPMPVWFRPLPWVQWSEFATWAQVNKWALSLFTNPAPLSPDLARQVAAWQRLAGPEEKVLSVLRFVQEEVRYQGIESGAGAYTPTDPSTVFARRFGDCKDKTFLCVTILRALKIEAYPVLVATDYRQTLADWLPTDEAFDHAIVRVTVGGQVYWLDPTATCQRGDLATRSWANYGRGLVLRPGTTDLAVIPESPVKPKTTVLEYLFIRPLGQPADLKVVTIADGPDADHLRRKFSATDRNTIASDDLNGFAALYPGIVRAAPLDYVNDEKADEVIVTEYYQIDKIANRLPTAPGLAARFYSYNVDRAAKKPAVSLRSMPLGLDYPIHQVFRAEISLSGPVPVNPGNWTVDNPAFHFHKTVALSGGKILLEEEYGSLADNVPVDAVPNYLLQLDQVSELLDYVLVSF